MPVIYHTFNYGTFTLRHHAMHVCRACITTSCSHASVNASLWYLVLFHNSETKCGQLICRACGKLNKQSYLVYPRQNSANMLHALFWATKVITNKPPFTLPGSIGTSVDAFEVAILMTHSTEWVRSTDHQVQYLCETLKTSVAYHPTDSRTVSVTTHVWGNRSI